MKKDYKHLLDSLDDDTGPTVGDVTRHRKMNTLLEKVLESMAKPAPVPQVTVAVPESKPAQVVVQPPKNKAVAWTFEFERNDDGTIKRIHATPKE